MIDLTVDINADVGEGIGNESQLFPLISSCNIACGGHAGNEVLMREVIGLSVLNNVKIGAHPSFPDKMNFGREVMQLSSMALFDSIKDQINTLQLIANDEGVALHHIKPHGALYNLSAIDEKTARIVVEVIKTYYSHLKLYVPFRSVIANVALNEGLSIIYEAFADRNYNEDLSLVSRHKTNAVKTDANDIYNHVYNIIRNQKVKTINGVEVPIKASTICIHGDNPKALELAYDLNIKLTNAGFKIQ